MKSWKSFIAIGIKQDGGISVIGTLKSLQPSKEKFRRIIVGPRAQGIGGDVLLELVGMLERDGVLESWRHDELVNFWQEQRKLL